MCALGEARHFGIMRLYVSSEDPVRDLPGPDLTGIKEQLGPDNRIVDVIRRYGIRVRPEYICMAACLSKRCVSTRLREQRRVSLGRCEVCARRHYSVHYCRIQCGHTA